MKIKIYTIISCLILFNLVLLVSAQSGTSKYTNNLQVGRINQDSYKTGANIDLLDSTYIWSWDEKLNEWQLTSRLIPYYDIDGKVINLIKQNNLSADTEWVNISNKFYTYNANNDTLSAIEQYWDSINNAWANKVKYTSTYDNLHNELTRIIEEWDTIKSNWSLHNKITNVFTGKKMSSTYTEYWKNNAWFKLGNVTNYKYNSFGELSMKEYGWIDNGVLIVNTYETYTYDLNHLKTGMVASIMTLYPSGMELEKSAQRIYRYDSQQNLIEVIDQAWCNLANKSDWCNNWREQIDYDVSNHNILNVLQYYDFSINDWVNSVSSFNFYSEVTTGFESPHNSFTILDIYPNPASNSVNISANTLQNKEVYMYDMTGRLVYSGIKKHGESQPNIDVSNFEKGVYIVKLGDNCKKLIVE
ncbi:MAG: T9SS type A sorting domain-containing protein [Bacteroidetes bacterium]|nr:T9SS type A sorting domain-containing protein [Bacteroidota bacterium]